VWIGEVWNRGFFKVGTSNKNAELEPARPSLDEVLGIVERCLGIPEVADILDKAGLETFLTAEQQSFVDGKIDGFFTELGYPKYQTAFSGSGETYQIDTNTFTRRMMIALMRRILVGKIPTAKGKEAIAFAVRSDVTKTDYTSRGALMHVNEFAYVVDKLWHDPEIMKAVRLAIGRNHDDEESQQARIIIWNASEKLRGLHAFPDNEPGLIGRFLKQMEHGDFDSPLSPLGLEILRHQASFKHVPAALTFEGDSNV
jgi:hypothetical protein